ncbi:MAG: nucleotidyltransferase family protein [Magnetococcales bacterium]|nr:nucleotidyltransferase family protein [Magnetococcales bacterium]
MNGMILAAGKGDRLQPLTLHTPKPLVKVAGKSIIEHTIKGLVALGIDRLVVNVWHLADELMAAVGDGSQWGAQVVWSREERLLNTGGGVRQALDNLGHDPCLLVNGDILWDLDLTPLLARFDVKSMDALLGLVENPPYKKSDFCCDVSSGMLRRAEGQEPGSTYAGIMVFDPQAMAGYPIAPFSLNQLFDDALQRGRLFGLSLKGRWADMGTPERLAQVQSQW